MSLQRSQSWSAALRDLRNDRAPIEERRAAIAAQQAASLAKSLAVVEAREAVRIADAAPLFVEGRYDRAAIMKRAWARARCFRAQGATGSWRRLLSLELRLAWSWARDARRVAAH